MRDVTRIKEWNCCRAEFHVKTPPKDLRKGSRRDQLIKGQSALKVGLSRSPYVEVSMNGSMLRALVDSGADWSMLDYTSLTQEELGQLSSSQMVGQGVSREPVTVIGEVWRDVQLGNVTIPRQRFVVIKNMVTAAILGADFWVRLGELTLNFKEKRMKMVKLGVDLELFETDTPSMEGVKKDTTCPVILRSNIEIPPNSEIMVEGEVKGVDIEGSQVLVEPWMDDDAPTNVPFTVCRVRDGKLTLRMANISDHTVNVEEGAEIGMASVNACVLTKRKGWKNSRKAQWGYKDAKIGEDLDGHQRKELTDLLMQYNDVFYDGGELPLVRVGVEHTIRVKEDSGPIAFNPRRVSRETEKELRDEVKSLERMGIIQPSNSPWASPVVCARRSDGSLRLALDYRALNGVSLPATLHPIPRVDGLIDRLSEAKYFAMLDAKCGYHQMPLKDGEEGITAFVVPFGQYEFCKRTPFGLKGAGYSFQRFMSVILGESNFQDAICYLDDVLVWGATWGEFITRLRRVLERISVSGLALSAKKCSFGVNEVYYLGALIKNGKVCIGENRTRQLKELPRPNNLAELRSALGAFSYVQRWLPGLAEVNRPLYDLLKNTKQGMRLNWSEECDKAFETLKKMVGEAVELRIPVDGVRFTLVTDASSAGTGAMLAQKVDDTLIPVAFYHHALTQEETKYNTTERELLAVVKACKKFRVYLERPFDLITDHSALRWLKSLDAEDCRGRRARWIDFLQQFDMNLIHKKGKSIVMSMADYLSRVDAKGDVARIAPLKMKKDGIPCLVDEILNTAQVKQIQQEDEEIRKWAEAVGENWKEIPVKERPHVHDRMFVDEGGILRVLYNGGRKTKKNPCGVREKYRVVFPKSKKNVALALCHNAPLAGHMGIRRTWKRAVETFWWPDMKQDAEAYVKNCENCGLNKHSTKKSQAPIQKTDMPARVCERLQVDFVGPFGISEAHEYRYALQIQDILSRYLIFVPTVRNDASTAAAAVFDDWVCLFGFPLKIQSDQGRHFAGQVFEEMCRLNGIGHRMGAVGHAQSQGQVERQNQLLNQVRALCNNSLDTWPQAILRIQHAHNTALNEVTGISPYEIMFAQKPNHPESMTLLPQEKVQQCMVKAEELDVDPTAMGKNQSAKERLKNLLTSVCKENTITHQDKVIERQDCKVQPYKAGDLVRIRLNAVQQNARGGKKISPRNSEPFIIIKVMEHSKWTYELVKLDDRNQPNARILTRHFNELVPCQMTLSQEEPDPIEGCYWIVRRTVGEKSSHTKPGPELVNKKDTSKDTNTSKDAGPAERRYPARMRKPPPTLQMTFDNKKKYDERAIQSYDEDVEEDSDGIDGDGGGGEVGSDDSTDY